ncbi:glutathione S-transferase [Rhodoligotrophos appendicifer]|uniref:glutathione transferase GstA n=1 Tax=Rhodoligotrophos appendicifer TaxID=987056 RepID=UPI00117D1CC6|nr:glutathione transferase GstA [Rhodoligotrophos appendicifer]
MKLYLSPGACSLAPHIALHEAGLAHEIEKVNLGTKKTASGADFFQINPKGQVPTLVLDDGSVLTENPAILNYIADKAPEAHLAPAPGSLDRYHLIEWLNYVSAELHKPFGPLFKKDVDEAVKAYSRSTIEQKLSYMDKALEKNKYLTGDQFTIVDGYAFTVLRWTQYTGFDMGKYPHVKAYMDRVAERPKVKAALAAEA